MDRFLAELRNRSIVLENAVDIVRFSYSTQDSIAYLNLNLCEYSASGSDSREYFISTEEKCRKIFAKSHRSLLYNLHLDLAKGREYNVREDDSPFSMYQTENDPHIGSIRNSYTLCSEILSGFIEEALKVTGEKLKIVKMLTKPALEEEEVLHYLEPRVVNELIDCFYTEDTDSVAFRGFFTTFNLDEWVAGLATPDHLECILRQACHHGLERAYPFCELIEECIQSRSFLNIGPLLKVVDALEFSSDYHYWYNWYIDEISPLRPSLTRGVFDEAKRWMTMDRITLTLLILWMFIDSSQRNITEMASEALRLLWNSIPDACVTFEEIEGAVGGRLSHEELRNVHDFYCRSIRETHSDIEPRSLKHLCKTTVRRILCENKVWIPEGVDQFGLPNLLKGYLNLE